MNATIEEFAKKHPVGFCWKPKDFGRLAAMKATTQFMAVLKHLFKPND